MRILLNENFQLIPQAEFALFRVFWFHYVNIHVVIIYMHEYLAFLIQ